jgi:hypothetical protein
LVHRIRRFEPFSTAKVAGVIYAIFGLIFAPIFILASMFAPDEAGVGIGLAVAIPIIYGIIGFIGTLIAAAIYNLVAGWVGGIEVELD